LDKLTFASNVIGSIVWPITIVVALYFLRKEIPTIAKSIKKFKYKDFEIEIERDGNEDSIQDIEEDIETIVDSSELKKSEKKVLINARVGQGQFRRKLLDYWKGCAVTGTKESRLLIATHIKPWSVSTNEERVDPYNGLLLIPTLDSAFDRGLISFSDSGKIILSSKIKEASKLGIDSEMSIKLNEKHLSYLKYHREHIFNDE